MSLVKIYIKSILAAFVALFVFGLIAPALISSRDTALCIIGFLLLALIPAYIFLVGKHLYKSTVSIFKKVTNSEI